MGDDEVCISQAQYNELLNTSVNVEDTMTNYVVPTLKRLDEAVRGNGKEGLQTRVAVLEAVNNIENEYTSELGQAKRDVLSQRIAAVKESAVDWKWIGSLLLQAVLLGYLVIRI
jgi:hypothetical protein